MIKTILYFHVIILVSSMGVDSHCFSHAVGLQGCVVIHFGGALWVDILLTVWGVGKGGWASPVYERKESG